MYMNGCQSKQMSNNDVGYKLLETPSLEDEGNILSTFSLMNVDDKIYELTSRIEQPKQFKSSVYERSVHVATKEKLPSTSSFNSNVLV